MSLEQERDSDNLVTALSKRLNTEVERIGSPQDWPLAETRLAASSAGLLLLFVLLSAALLFVSWLLLMALAWQGLLVLGFSVVAALTVLLGVHLLAAGALLFAGWRVSRHLAFTHTRKALAKAREKYPADRWSGVEVTSDIIPLPLQSMIGVCKPLRGD